MATYPELAVFVIFNMKETRDVVRPKILKYDDFNYYVKAKLITTTEFSPPPYMLKDENELNQSDFDTFKGRWNSIESLVEDKELLLSIATKSHQPKLVAHSKLMQIHTKTIYRNLNLYWRYGQIRGALYSKYFKCGGAGNQRNDETNSLGRKIISRSGASPDREPYKIRNPDKENIKKAVNKYYLRPQGVSLNQTYREYLREFFATEIQEAHLHSIIPNVPSIQQFRMWVKKLFDKDQLIKNMKHEVDYLTNYRDNLNSIVSDYGVPGSCFEIDATVIDVHIVSKWNRNKVLGRPTLYFIVDRASGMIVGFSLSLFHASWDAARLAIHNAFSNKVEYCRNNGVKIQQKDWPCSHIPSRLVADNAEMLGLKAEAAIVPMVPLEFSPLARPDTKPFVEGAFNTLNQQLVHSLLGSTKTKGKIVSAAPDPRSKAIYTLEELRKLLIRAILDKNSQVQKSLAYKASCS